MKAVLFLKVSKKCKGKKITFCYWNAYKFKKNIVLGAFFCCSNHLVGIYLVAALGVGKKSMSIPKKYEYLRRVSSHNQIRIKITIAIRIKSRSVQNTQQCLRRASLYESSHIGIYSISGVSNMLCYFCYSYSESIRLHCFAI